MRWLRLAGCVTACACATAQPPGEEPSPLTRSPAAKRQGALQVKVQALLTRSPPAPAEEWKPLGAEALGVLQQVANDPASDPVLRLRALGAVPKVDSPEARAVLEGYAKDPHQSADLRGAALTALLDLPPASAAATLAKSLLDDGAPPVRAAAAQALARVGGTEAREALEGRLEHEEDGAVRDALQRALTALQP